MNAYNYFYAHTETTPLPASDHSQETVKFSPLTEPQLEFLNSCACQHVNPYSKDFWSELLSLLRTESQQVQDLPKSPDYRYALEPYMLRRVHMAANTWFIHSCGDGRIRLLLKDVRLTHVHGGTVGLAPNATVGHLNIWVSPRWLNRVVPACDEPLILDGVLYEYASNQTRNIGILPVLLMPQNRRPNAYWRNRAVYQDMITRRGSAA